MKTDQNETMKSGDAKTIRVTVTDDDNSGVPLDLSGMTIRWWASRKNSSGVFSSTAIIQKDTVGGGITVPDAAGGVFEVSLDPADTEDIGDAELFHEAQLTDSGSPSTIMDGTLTIQRDLVTTV